MKTAEEIILRALSVWGRQNKPLAKHLEKYMREEYGSQVREEAAKIAETLPCRFHPVVECHDACAAAIRKMELP